MSDMYAWIHDDITWCTDHSCPIVSCMRNPKNMANKEGLHSYASFRETDECPIYRMEEQASMERDDMTK